MFFISSRFSQRISQHSVFVSLSVYIQKSFHCSANRAAFAQSHVVSLPHEYEVIGNDQFSGYHAPVDVREEADDLFPVLLLIKTFRNDLPRLQDSEQLLCILGRIDTRQRVMGYLLFCCNTLLGYGRAVSATSCRTVLQRDNYPQTIARSQTYVIVRS